MNEALFHLVYYSRNRIAGDGAVLEAAIGEILGKSRINNDAAGVSGALMFNAGCFAQVLEGPQDAVETTFERIQQDERHGDVSLLAFGPIQRRSFDSWSMAFVGQSNENAGRYGHIAGDSGFDPSTITGDKLYEILRRLILDEEQEAA